MLRGRGVRCWVMGGWGVDALLGAQSREHHDLDVLVPRDDLAALGDVFRDHGFEIRHVWETENRWVDVDGNTWPTAFVAATQHGVELDVHVIERRSGAVIPVCNVPWTFGPGSLEGRGVIAGRPVDCLSAESQLAMHRGYELPEAHQRDVEILRRLSS